MAKISGVLTDGAGNVINNCTIELYAKKTTSKVLTQTQVFQVANNGSYMMNVLPCDYEVKLIINGFPPKRLGSIQVFSDSKDGTLNDFLLNPSESEITPAILQQVIDSRNHANKSAEKSANSERNSKISETNAKTSADNAKNIANSVENLVANASNSAQSASSSSATATNASASAKSYSDSAKSYADSASASATASRNSAQQSSNSANAAKTSEQNAKKSADDAKNWASSVDTTNFIKKTIGDQRLMPFRRDELPFGWYFRNGDNFLLDSPQGQVLNSLSANYKNDHRITIKTINGKRYINVPTAFYSDGRGFFERAVNGTTRQVGSTEDDAIRNIKGAIPNGPGRAVIGHENITKGEHDGAMSVYHCDDDWLQVGPRRMRWAFFDFDASRVVPTANENRPINIGLTPAIYLGV
ncbi:prophage tail fiber N-terminal domain-containing protein [Gilliamella sp. B3482]|uniref:prophage tail fiber N-terminal domain-containing protein n=2 Tax=unclassified Gilliamella TaxID=2685620 RepID=UPI002269801A|nr:prophage tail fiber N-terminal domain-containing protein [Gilliamella sp. B3482]MCX8581165.1 prophage tail fiber N-terminal domain-containing protein [Gilliamella sp. B3482]